MKFDSADVQVTGIWNGNGHGIPFCTIKVTHIPTGISVESEKYRSQHKMRAQAMNTLKELVEARLI